MDGAWTPRRRLENNELGDATVVIFLILIPDHCCIVKQWSGSQGLLYSVRPEDADHFLVLFPYYIYYFNEMVDFLDYHPGNHAC